MALKLQRPVEPPREMSKHRILAPSELLVLEAWAGPEVFCSELVVADTLVLGPLFENCCFVLQAF